MKNLIRLIPFILFFLACSKDKAADITAGPDYEIISIYPHDTSYFTQGFEFEGDTLIEGTGRNGYSKLIKYDPETSDIFGEYSLGSSYFGEGITEVGGKIYQLTWTEGKCFVYDYLTLSQIKVFSYAGEGWGLCCDSASLIMSDGSDRLYFRNPADFSLIKTISVKTSDGFPQNDLNELEYAEGMIWANIWGEDHIVSIDPSTGTIIKRYDLSDLRIQALDENPYSDVLNGIAYKEGYFYITGKYWPYIFKITFSEK